MTTLLLVIVIITIPMIPAGVFLGWYFHKQVARIERLEEQERKRKLPGRYMDGMEDSMAIVNDCNFQNAEADQLISALADMLAKSEATRSYMNNRHSDLMNRLQILRTAPNKYDSDTPNNKRTT